MIKIDYERSYKNNFRLNVNEAVKFYLNSIGGYNTYFTSKIDNVIKEDVTGFILYPQALNPFLKVMETMKEVKNIVIVPAFNNDGNNPEEINNPAYLIIRLPEGQYINEFNLNK